MWAVSIIKPPMQVFHREAFDKHKGREAGDKN